MESLVIIIGIVIIFFCLALWLFPADKKVSDNKDDTDSLDSPAPAADSLKLASTYGPFISSAKSGDSLNSNTHGFENDDLFKIFKALNHMRWMMFGFMLLIVVNILIPMFL